MHYFRLMLFLLLLSAAGMPTTTTAQNRITLVIALPDWLEGQLGEAIFDDFEAQHVDVEVALNFLPGEELYFAPPQVDFETHINGTLAYASQGDVLFTGSYQMSVEGTRTGAYLDLSPLVASDTDLDISDFYPALWQSFQWDGALWAIPVGGSLVMNVYDKNAFDVANVAYPDASWTMTNYASVARELALFKASGAIDTPGINSYYVPSLFYSLLNRGMYDATTFPETANLVNDDIIEVLTTWTQLMDEGVANPHGAMVDNLDEVPLHIEEIWRVTNQYMPKNSDWQATLLPNNRAGMRVEAYAVSSGTDYPELSYELIMYMSQNPDIANLYFFDMPARQSMRDVENENSALVFGERSPELEALLEDAMRNAIPVAEMRYYGYLELAIQLIQGENKSVEDALIVAQQKLNENLQKAADIGAETTIIVEAPANTPALAEDEIALNFGMNTLISPLPNRDEWDRVAEEFVASDLEVGLIDFNFDLGNTQGYDCFYRQYNNLSNAVIEDLLPIDPFLNADANFHRNDIPSRILAQVTRDNQIWGMPMNMTPVILWINEDLFTKAGVPIPDTQWTVDEFVDALMQLSTITEDPPYEPRSLGSIYLTSLIAAFGGLPFDPSHPDTIPDLDSDQNINAIRQVLNLARNGYIDYEGASDFTGGRIGLPITNTPIYDATLSAMDFRMQQRRVGNRDNYRAVLFPSGTQYTPLTFDVGASYINADTPYADACYRWIAYLAQHPQLFDGMPARRSQLETTQSQGEDLYNLYNTIDAQLSDPNTIIIPLNFIGASAYFNQQWVYRAFDAYVLDGVSLEDALADAKILINDYANCIAPIEPIDSVSLETQAEMNAYYRQFVACAGSVDPIFADQFDTGN